MLALALLLAAADPVDPVDPAPVAPLTPTAEATDDAKDAAIIFGGVTGGLFGGVIGGVGAGVLFIDAVQARAVASGCEAEECEGFGLTLFFYTPFVVLGGAALGLVAGAVGGGWVGSELADADGTTPEPIED